MSLYGASASGCHKECPGHRRIGGYKWKESVSPETNIANRLKGNRILQVIKKIVIRSINIKPKRGYLNIGGDTVSRGVWRTSLVDTRLIKRPARDIHGIIGRIHSIVVYSGIVERGKENQKPKGGEGGQGRRGTFPLWSWCQFHHDNNQFRTWDHMLLAAIQAKGTSIRKRKCTRGTKLDHGYEVPA